MNEKSLMLPEHKALLKQWAVSQYDISMPTLDEDQLQDINLIITRCLEEKCIVEVIYYESKRFKSVWGRILRCDLHAGNLMLENSDSDRISIPLQFIKDIHLQ
ncbi:YolD-like family protein [Paenibacillus peoriae]|nr:YolD-like family protein [Paenibacillus peoriae]